MVRNIQKWQISFDERRLYHFTQISAIYYEKPETVIKDEFKRLKNELLFGNIPTVKTGLPFRTFRLFLKYST